MFGEVLFSEAFGFESVLFLGGRLDRGRSESGELTMRLVTSGVGGETIFDATAGARGGVDGRSIVHKIERADDVVVGDRRNDVDIDKAAGGGLTLQKFTFIQIATCNKKRVNS